MKNNLEMELNQVLRMQDIVGVKKVLDDKSCLEEWAKEMSIKPETIHQLNLRIGLGGHDKEKNSLRLPAYTQIAVEIYTRLNEVYTRNKIQATPENFPKLTIYAATNGVIAANQLNRERAEENTRTQLTFIRGFLKHILKEEIIGNINLEHDLQPSEELTMMSQDLAEEILRKHPNDPSVQKIIANAKRHHADPIKGLQYGVHHAVYSLDPIDITERGHRLVQNDPKNLPERLIMIGGAGEMPYWGLRQLIQKMVKTNDTYQRVQIIQESGEIPPYIQPFQEDLTLEDLESEDPKTLDISKMRRAFQKEISWILKYAPLDILKGINKTNI